MQWEKIQIENTNRLALEKEIQKPIKMWKYVQLQ